MLCDYGCGREAIKYFKTSKKWCCSNNVNSCPEIIKKKNGKQKTSEFKKLREANRKGKKLNRRIKLSKFEPINTVQFCSYGCGKIANFYCKKLDKYCCVSEYRSCEGIGKKAGAKRKGKPTWNKEKKTSPETLLLLSRIRKGVKKPPRTLEHRKNLSISQKGKIIPKNQIEKQAKKIQLLWKDPNSKYNSKSFRNKLRDHCLNGHALVMIKAIKKISKEEIKLREMVQQLYPNCEFQFKVFNYSLDVALVDYKIAIEYDGYYHFNTPENIEYYKLRQKRIEDEGWVFYRVTMFDAFPSIVDIKYRIIKLTSERNSKL